MIITGQLLDLGWHFNPAEPRGPHGQWMRTELAGYKLWSSPEGRATPTPAEAAAVTRIWYGDTAAATNRRLREGPGADTPPTFTADTSAFTGLIDRSPAFDKPAVMWRGTYGGTQMFGPPGTATGKTFSDKGYVSVSAAEDTALKYGDTLVRVHVPPGAHALRAGQEIWDAAPAIQNQGGKQEYTLAPGSSYRVTADGTEHTMYGPRRVLDVALQPGQSAPVTAANQGRAVELADDGDPAAARFAWKPGDVEFGPGTAEDQEPASDEGGRPVQLGWRFNPLEARDPHGEWTRGGLGYVAPDPSRLVIPHPPKNTRFPYYRTPEDHPFFRAHPVSSKNVVASYDAASPEEKAQGMRWYADAATLAGAIGRGDQEKGAGLLASYSPQTPWPVNMFNASHAMELGRALGPGDGMITKAMQANAQEALDGVPTDKNFGRNSAPKIRAFARLIEHGGDEPGDQLGHVVIDRHAMTVAMGDRLPKKEADQAPIGTDRYYQHVADQYRLAALEVSKRGTPVTPHQMQAITWLHQQAVNAAMDDAYLSQVHGSRGATKGRQALMQRSWERWDAEAKAEGYPVNYGTTALSTLTGQLIDLGWRDSWLHEERDTRGKWTHGGGGLASEPGRLEQHGYRGRFEGYDPLRPSMAPADQRKPLDQPGRPDGAGTPDDPIDVQGDMGKAVQLMADGKHVRLNSPSEIKPLLDEVDRRATAQGYSRGNEPAWDLGNISVKGTRLFNEQTLGIPRQDMPQLSGPAEPGTEAALLAGGANRFIELDPEFRAQLKRDGIDVKNERVPAGNLRATQTQLTAATVAGITKAAESGNAKVRHMLSEPIWVTSDNYVLDGHHRWASDEALAFSGQGPRDIEVQRIGLPARLAVPYTLAFTQQTGIGSQGIGNAKLVESANTLTAQLIELGHWEGWRTEPRDRHGRWTRLPGQELLGGAFVLPGSHPRTGSPVPAQVRDMTARSANIVPGLFGGGSHEDWNGKVEILGKNADPHELAELDWDGTMRLQDTVSAAIQDTETHPDQVVKFPDAYETVLHEMIHGVIPSGYDRKADARSYQDYAHAQIEEGFTELGAVQHAPDYFAKMGLSDRKTGVEKSGFVEWGPDGKPIGNTYTVGEYATELTDPSHVAEGDAWGHYGQQTKDAQDWVQQIAKEEGYPDLRPGHPGYTRVVQLADEVNREGTARKIQVMARQMAEATVRDPRLKGNQDFMASLTGSIEKNIQDAWSRGEPEAAKTAFRDARRNVQVRMVQAQREMAA